MGILNIARLRFAEYKQLWGAYAYRESGNLREARVCQRLAGVIRMAKMPDDLLLFRAERPEIDISTIGSKGASTWLYFDLSKFPRNKSLETAIREELDKLRKLYGGNLVFTTLGELRKVSISRNINGKLYPQINFDLLANPASHYGGMGIAIVAEHNPDLSSFDYKRNQVVSYTPLKATFLSLDNLPGILRSRRKLAVLRAS